MDRQLHGPRVVCGTPAHQIAVLLVLDGEPALGEILVQHRAAAGLLHGQPAPLSQLVQELGERLVLVSKEMQAVGERALLRMHGEGVQAQMLEQVPTPQAGGQHSKVGVVQILKPMDGTYENSICQVWLSCPRWIPWHWQRL